MERDRRTKLVEARKLIEQARVMIDEIATGNGEEDDLADIELTLGETIETLDEIIGQPEKKLASCKMSDENLLKAVREAMRNATQNGYDVGGPSRKLAQDMVRHDYALEDESVDRVAQAIVQIRIQDDDPFAVERDRDDPELNPSLRGRDPFDD